MITIKRNYLTKSKEILRDMNKHFYSFSKVTIIIECDNSKTIVLNNNEKTSYWINNDTVIVDIIHALNDVKSIDIVMSDYLESLVLN